MKRNYIVLITSIITSCAAYSVEHSLTNQNPQNTQYQDHQPQQENQPPNIQIQHQVQNENTGDEQVDQIHHQNADLQEQKGQIQQAHKEQTELEEPLQIQKESPEQTQLCKQLEHLQLAESEQMKVPQQQIKLLTSEEMQCTLQKQMQYCLQDKIVKLKKQMKLRAEIIMEMLGLLPLCKGSAIVTHKMLNEYTHSQSAKGALMEILSRDLKVDNWDKWQDECPIPIILKQWIGESSGSQNPTIPIAPIVSINPAQGVLVIEAELGKHLRPIAPQRRIVIGTRPVSDGWWSGREDICEYRNEPIDSTDLIAKGNVSGDKAPKLILPQYPELQQLSRNTCVLAKQLLWGDKGMFLRIRKGVVAPMAAVTEHGYVVYHDLNPNNSEIYKEQAPIGENLNAAITRMKKIYKENQQYNQK